jgi:hypothetical protein
VTGSLPEDGYGASVAVDGQTIAVGAPRHDQGAIDGGALFIYEATSTGWQLVSQFTSDDIAPDDDFGHCVAIDGDTIVVGAQYKLESSGGIGAAYVIRKVGGVWQEVAKLTPNYEPRSRLFGESIAIHGNRLVVGATGEDTGGTSSGAAYVFEEVGGVWAPVAKLLAHDAAAFDQFGKSVAIEGDLVVVGAYGDDDFGASSGGANSRAFLTIS